MQHLLEGTSSISNLDAMVKSSHTLPNDLLEEILSRLPVKHLLLLRCVSKTWCALIDDYSFIKKQYQFQYDKCIRDGNNVPMFLDRTNIFGSEDPTYHMYFLMSKQHGEDFVLVNLTNDLHRDSRSFLADDLPLLDDHHCIGVVNGIICLQRWSDKVLALWNPGTREFNVVPRWPNISDDKETEECWQIIGFGFDSLLNDFKILRFIYDMESENIETVCQFEMYSLSTNSWRRLRGPSTFPCMTYPCRDGYINGVHHWIADELCDREKRQLTFWSVILSFDFCTEVFKVSDVPQGARCLCERISIRQARCRCSLMVGQYKSRLAVFASCSNLDEAICYAEIWVVTEFGAADDNGTPLSWQRLFKIEPIPAFSALWMQTFRADGNLLLTSQIGFDEDEDEESWLFNPSTRSLKKLGLMFGSSFSYMESLFPLSKRLVQT